MVEIRGYGGRDRPMSNDGNRGGDGSFIYAFATETGFAVTFKRGGGDCPAGCAENEYWYFVTDPACAPMQVGHFNAAWGPGNCLLTTVARRPPPSGPQADQGRLVAEVSMVACGNSVWIS